jgi:hypothetical protein
MGGLETRSRPDAKQRLAVFPAKRYQDEPQKQVWATKNALGRDWNELGARR